MQNETVVTIPVRVPSEVAAKLDAIADREERSRSSLLRKIVKDALSREQETAAQA